MSAGGSHRAAGFLLALALAVPAAAGAPPGPPSGCRAVAAGEALQPILDAARPGDALCLGAGTHAGPLRVREGITVWGPPEAWILSSGAGSTVSLTGAGAALLGAGVDGSGGRFETLDAAVRAGADDARVEGVRVRGALFGILVERARRVRIVANQVTGDPARPLGLRGDGIRLWEVSDSLVADNHLADLRDLVVWYSPRNRFEGNVVERSRYGMHFMYSHSNEVVGGRYLQNVVGLFAMYSRGIRIERNVLARSGGAAGVGLGLKESSRLEVRENALLANTVGIYVDTSPLEPGEPNLFERNAVRLGGAGVVFHGSARGNRFLGNSFRDNHAQVRVDGRGDALAAEWRGNDFDDYAGYDLDGDGAGDVPYALRSLSGELTGRVPALAFLRGSPALGLVELLGRVVPLFEARTLVVDPAPRLAALDPEPWRGD